MLTETKPTIDDWSRQHDRAQLVRRRLVDLRDEVAALEGELDLLTGWFRQANQDVGIDTTKQWSALMRMAEARRYGCRCVPACQARPSSNDMQGLTKGGLPRTCHAHIDGYEGGDCQNRREFWGLQLKLHWQEPRWNAADLFAPQDPFPKPRKKAAKRKKGT